jgi:hypothetical protein
MGPPGSWIGARPARAATGFSRRFLVWFTPNGTLTEKWRPTGSETSFTVAPMIGALAKHKDKLLWVDGVYLKHALGDAHTDGMGGCLTGRPLKGGTTSFGTGISVDQEIAKHIKTGTALASLEVAPKGIPGTTWGRMNYDANAQPMPLLGSPSSTYKRLFDAGVPSGAGAPTGDTQQAIEKLRFQRRSVLDVVKQDFAALTPRASKLDREKLDAHFTRIRELEGKLDTLTPSAAAGPACRANPAAPASSSDYLKNAQVQMDLVVYALACERTRVASFMWDHAASNLVWSFIGVGVQHHQSFHDGNFGAQEKIWIEYAKQFAYLLDKMREVKEGDGTLLDNSLVLWTSEQANGYRHSHDNMPLLLAGNAGGTVTTNRWLKYTGNPPHNNLLVSILNAMGVPATRFGTPEWCTGPLPRVVG